MRNSCALLRHMKSYCVEKIRATGNMLILQQQLTFNENILTLGKSVTFGDRPRSWCKWPVLSWEILYNFKGLTAYYSSLVQSKGISLRLQVSGECVLAGQLGYRGVFLLFLFYLFQILPNLKPTHPHIH
jgi:hypothetical protein